MLIHFKSLSICVLFICFFQHFIANRILSLDIISVRFPSRKTHHPICSLHTDKKNVNQYPLLARVLQAKHVRFFRHRVFALCSCYTFPIPNRILFHLYIKPKVSISCKHICPRHMQKYINAFAFISDYLHSTFYGKFTYD